MRICRSWIKTLAITVLCLCSRLLLPVEVAQRSVATAADTVFSSAVTSDGIVSFAAIQADGKMLLGGDFTSINRISLRNLARLNADGSLDTNFNPIVESIWPWKAVGFLPRADGKIYIAGSFSTVNGVALSTLARLNTDGTLDTSFVPHLTQNSSSFYAAAQLTRGIYIAGKLLMGTTLLNEDGSIAADYGAAAASHDPGLPGSKLSESFAIASATQSDGKILVVRQRNYLVPPRPADSAYDLIRLNADGSYGESFPQIDLGGQPDYYRLSIVVQPDDRFFVYGHFTVQSAPQRVPRFTRNGQFDPTFSLQVSGQFAPLLIEDNEELLVPTFGLVNGVRVDGFASVFPDGALDLGAHQGSLPANANTILFRSRFSDRKVFAIGSVYGRVTPLVIQQVPVEDAPICLGCGSPEPPPRLGVPKVSSTALEFQLQTLTHNRYTLEYKDQLQDTTWHSSGTVIGDGGKVTLTHAIDYSAPPRQQYFRLRAE